jgi:hypothetical protein
MHISRNCWFAAIPSRLAVNGFAVLRSMEKNGFLGLKKFAFG